MSMPRLAFTENMFSAVNSFPQMGIAFSTCGGAFWEQALSSQLYKRVEEGFDYIFTVDYDSAYTRQDVADLLSLIETSGADAVFAMQIKRDCGQIIGAIHPSEFVDGKCTLNKPLTRCDSGHFGLTVIRASSLAKMPHPWFHSIPNHECKWGDGKVDSDIFFWCSAMEQKWQVYMANNVRIGHIQQMVTFPTAAMTHVQQYVDEYHKSGKPLGVDGPITVPLIMPPDVVAPKNPFARNWDNFPESPLEPAGVGTVLTPALQEVA